MSDVLEAVVVFPDGVPPVATLGRATDASGAALPPGERELWSLPDAEVPSLLLRCAALPGRPIDRPGALCRSLAALSDAGATAAWLPVARHWLDAAAMRALPTATRASLAIRHVVHRDGDVWLHSHGLALYGLPDLECRVAVTALARGHGLLDDATAYLLDGGDALAPGRVIEAPGRDGQLIRVAIDLATPDPDHPFGDHGAWTLRLLP